MAEPAPSLDGLSEAQVETLWDRDGATAYQTRVKCGRFRIHIFWRGDRDPDMHDHPSDFWTFPLVSYVEEWADGWRLVRAFRLHRRKAGFAHRVLGAWSGHIDQYGTPHINCRPIVTLGWWSKKRREWGFHTPTGWVPWQVYVKTPGWDAGRAALKEAR